MRKLCAILEQRVADALNLELQQFIKAPSISDEVYEDDKRRTREAFILQITVIREARVLIERWRLFYNHQRPHSALNYRTPAQARQQSIEESKIKPRLTA